MLAGLRDDCLPRECQVRYLLLLGGLPAAAACAQVPAVNAVIDGDEIVYRDYTDISIAVATPKGLVVPVLRSADELSFADVEKARPWSAVQRRDCARALGSILHACLQAACSSIPADVLVVHNNNTCIAGLPLHYRGDADVRIDLEFFVWPRM